MVRNCNKLIVVWIRAKISWFLYQGLLFSICISRIIIMSPLFSDRNDVRVLLFPFPVLVYLSNSVTLCKKVHATAPEHVWCQTDIIVWMPPKDHQRNGFDWLHFQGLVVIGWKLRVSSKHWLSWLVECIKSAFLLHVLKCCISILTKMSARN